MTDGNGGVKDDGVEPTGLEPVETDSPAPPEIEALRLERDGLRDQLLRKRADFENFRKRVERDRSQAGVDAVVAFVEALIPVLDNLDRALSADASEGSLREGVELIQREFRAILEGQGVTVDDPKGHSFDPEVHQALSHEPVPGFEEGVVVEVFRKAYFLKGRLLRPALVKVAKGATPEPEAERDQESVH
jgi:molecular chaperone GrpE